MKIPLYQIDAFTGRLFGGNPAAVCPLTEWPADELLQSIAAENNLAETAYFVPKGKRFHLRWFTPALEVDLCGHATLAAAFLIFSELQPELKEIYFDTRSGELVVKRQGEMLAMDFPARPPKPVETPPELVAGLGATPKESHLSRDYLALFGSEKEILALEPDFGLLSKVDSLGVIATAPGREVDFVSRFFAPRAGILEDPVTGSAHCTLVPFWSQRLGKREMRALQLSKRRGEILCTDNGERVTLAGKAVKYSEGTIFL